MKVEKIIKNTKEIDLQIEEITLLSKEEYLAAKDIIPARHDWWWLRSPYRYDTNYAGVVRSIGNFNYDPVVDGSDGVSPALKIRDLKSSNLEVGDQIILAGYTWTVISDDYILCDSIVGKTCFRKDWKAPDANVYEKSDIKKWLEAWAKEHGIEVEGE